MEIVTKVRECAMLFYQNREVEAYQIMNEILPVMNQELQRLLQISSEYERIVAMIMQQFLEAYQQKDHLALADLMEYLIANVLETGTGEWI